MVQNAGNVLQSMFKHLIMNLVKETMAEDDEMERILQSKLSLKLLLATSNSGSQLYKGTHVKDFIVCHMEGIKIAMREDDHDRQVELLTSLNTVMSLVQQQHQQSTDANLMQRLLHYLNGDAKKAESNKKNAKRSKLDDEKRQAQRRALTKQAQELIAMLGKQVQELQNEKDNTGSDTIKYEDEDLEGILLDDDDDDENDQVESQEHKQETQRLIVALQKELQNLILFFEMIKQQM